MLKIPEHANTNIQVEEAASRPKYLQSVSVHYSCSAAGAVVGATLTASSVM